MSVVSVDDAVAAMQAGNPEWRNLAVLAGLGRRITVGTLSTGIAGGGAGTIVDLDQPELMVGIPAGAVFYLLSYGAQVHVPLLATDADEVETFLAVDHSTVFADDGTTVTEVIRNMIGNRPDNSGAIFVRSTGSADVTDPVLENELGRSPTPVTYRARRRTRCGPS